MVGVAGQDGLGAEKLLGQEYPDQQMRPCQRSQGQDLAGAGENRGSEPFGPADDEADGPGLGAPAFQQPGQGLTVRGRAGEVEGDGKGGLGRAEMMAAASRRLASAGARRLRGFR